MKESKMLIIQILLVVCIVVFLTLTIYLIYWNRSPAIYSQLLSIVVGFSTIGFALLFFSLKSEKYKKQFYVYTMVDSKNHPFLPTVFYLVPADKVDMSKALANDNIMTSSKVGSFMNDIYTKSTLNEDFVDIQNQNDGIRLYSELIRYKILSDIRWLSKEHVSGRTFYKQNGQKYISEGTHIPIYLDNLDTCSSETYSTIMTIPYAKSKFEIWNRDFLLPANSMLELNSETFRNRMSPLFRLYRHNYYSLQLKVTNTKLTEFGVFPDGLDLPDITHEYSKNYRTMVFLISITCEFEKLSSLSKVQKDQKEWAKWLIDSLEEKYTD